MHKIGSRFYYFLAVALVMVVFSISTGLAQEEVYEIAYTDVFDELRRPAVVFPHSLHMEILEEEGCGACHHAPDPDTGELTYVEDEEVSCVECHGAEARDDAPGLREAFHGSCTVCHRLMQKAENTAGGPTTCGECHTAE